MSLKYFKRIFITTIILLIIVGIYIIYIKDDKKTNTAKAQTKETKISREISIGIIEFDTINPILTTSLEIQHLTKLIYEPIINISKDFMPIPAIAEEWSQLDDLTYIFKIDDSKKWEDGKNITVEDIIFTIEEIKSSDSIYKENVEKIKYIEKVDEQTFKIYLIEPIDFFEYTLCFPVLKEKEYNEKKPMGSGKYKVSKIDVNNGEIIIENNETKLIVKVFKNTTELYNAFTREKVDLIITTNTNYEQYIGNIGFEEKIITGREFYYISCENIEDEETRKSINDNINKKKIVYDLYSQKYVIADFPLAYGSFLNLDNEEEEKKNKFNKKIFTLSTNAENKIIAEEIKEQFSEKGIQINIETYKNSKADLILKSKTVPITPDIRSYYKDNKTTEQIAKIIKIENKEILKQEYEKIINKYYETQPFISLYFNSYIVLHNNKLKGDFSGNWYNFFYNIDTWYKSI